jgi:hypothetical protein
MVTPPAYLTTNVLKSQPNEVKAYEKFKFSVAKIAYDRFGRHEN